MAASSSSAAKTYDDLLDHRGRRILPLWGRWQAEGLTEGVYVEDHSPEALRNAKRLRREMSLPEVLLWKILKQRPNGLKFRRQHPYGKRIVMDFYCAERRLDIEIDGMAHDLGERWEGDERRDAFLASQGIQVVRFPATEVLKDVDAVANSVISFCAAMPPPSALRAATSPKGGGSIGIA